MIGVTDLYHSTTYTVAVRAINSKGLSLDGTGSTSFTTVAINPPSAPRDKTVSSSTTTSALISWLVPTSDGGSPITRYDIVLSYGRLT
jgi:hypothetical protein